jgi:hypothetical protein
MQGRKDNIRDHPSFHTPRIAIIINISKGIIDVGI